MLVSLNDVLEYGEKNNCAIPGFNVFGYEDAQAVVQAAKVEHSPVILMANRPAVEHMPVTVLAEILRKVAQMAEIPVCVHLDHSPSPEKVKEGIEAGFTSVMLDASQKPYEENVALTAEVVKMAHARGISVESEIGSVGYSDDAAGIKTLYTDPAEAQRFLEETGVDALAVSIGNVHRMTTQTVHLQFDRLKEIKKRVNVPLVLHGSSGIPDDELVKAIECGIRKVNIGTALRMVFGNTLRKQMEIAPEAFDRIRLFQRCMEEVQKKAQEKIRLMKNQNIIK